MARFASGRIKPAEATSVTLRLAGLIAALVTTAPPEGAVESGGELKIEKKQLSPAYCTLLVEFLCEQYANN